MPIHYALLISIGVLLVTKARATDPSFQAGKPIVLVNFSGLNVGDSITHLPGWSSPAPDDISGVEPRLPSIDSERIVLTCTNGSNRFATSPRQEIAEKFSASDDVYFSAWINRYSSASSGARIVFQSEDGISLGALTIEPGAPNRFGLSDANGEYRYSSEETGAKPNTWYEVVLVIRPDDKEVTSSRGYLFYREVSTQDELEIVPGFEAGVLMGYGDSLNATHFETWVLQLRNNVQIDNLALGTGKLEVRER